MKELNIRIEYPDRFKSKEVLYAVRDYLIELVNALEGRLAYRVEDIKDDWIMEDKKLKKFTTLGKIASNIMVIGD